MLNNIRCNFFSIYIFRLANVLGPGDKKISKKKNALQFLINEIVNDCSPYDVSVNRINKLINPSSKAN